MADDPRVRRVLAECREREERGETIDEQAIVAAHPELADALRQAFEGMEQLRRAFPAPTESDDERPSRAGTLLGPYRLDRMLGAGGMGEVWLAAVEGRVAGLDAGTRVAVKVIHPRLVASGGFFKRFLREAEIGRRLRHPNVVRTLDADEVTTDAGAERFLVLEYVEGQTLRDVLDDLGTLPEALCRHVGREVAQALGAIHAAGAVHRDLKPENVLVTKDHVVKVTDLGVARIAAEDVRLSQSGVFVGSLRYGAPEQFGKDAELDGRADLHALGVLLYELATGVHPFAGEEFPVVVRRILDETPRRLGELQPQASPFLEELVAQLLQKDPAKRPSAADDVARILDDGEESAWWRARSVALRAETRRPLRRVRIPRETALYGRDAELAKLRALFDRTKAGEGQVVLVEGEAGIGKSRLVDEFVGGLAQAGEDVNFLFGSYPPGGAATASGAFTTAYREHFGEASLEDSLRGYLTTTPLLVPAFAALLKGDAAPAETEPLTKDSLQTVFVQATRALAAERTTIVLIEDLHFAPEEGRALFASLALAVPGHRVLLIGATRPGLDEKWLAQLTSRAHAAQLSVPRLGPKELVHLLRDALKSERLAEELSALIAVKSDGNPFFVFELLRGLKEGQFLAQRPDGTWHTTQFLRDIQVPSSLVELVHARVADLDDDERNLLDVASCLGFEFDPLLVGRVLGMAPIPAMQTFAKIEKRHRLVRSSGRQCVFDHHQVQEALYGGLAEVLREQYHAGIAEALETGSGAAAKDPATLEGGLCVDLADHFLKGAQGPRTLRYLDAALTHVERGYLNDIAVLLAERALAVPGLVSGRERTELLLRQAGRFEILGRRESESRALDEALALADRDGDPNLRARALREFGWHLERGSRHDEAMVLLREAQVLARGARLSSMEACTTGLAGLVLYHLGRYAEAREHHERSLTLAREIGDRRQEAVATSNLGIVSISLGRYVEAIPDLERSVALARAIGDRRVESMAMGNLGLALLALGRCAEARELFVGHLGAARAIGDRRAETIALANMGNALQSLSRYAEARDYFERSLALAREIGEPMYEAAAIGCLAILHAALGRRAETRERAERSRVLAAAIGASWIESSAMHTLACLAEEEGNAAEAEVRLAEAYDLRVGSGLRADVVESLNARGALLVRLDRVGDARTALGEALALARELSLPGAELLAAARLAALPGGAVEQALAGLAAHEPRAEVRVAMEARFLLWQATHDRIHLAEAKRRLDSMIESAPPEDRESMRTTVRLHREILDAAAAAGL